MSISQITDKYPVRYSFLCCRKQNELTIPGGDHLIHNGDFVSIIATPTEHCPVFQKIGLRTNHQVKNTLIIGGGTISYYLAKTLI
ncbi:MAG: hypothetical protein ACLTX6_01050 [Lachnospiraceae bacterium]